MDKNIVGEYISFLRKKNGFTQAKLGDIIGVSDKAISKWENGEGLPDVTILPSLAIALNTTVDSILNGGPIPVSRMIKSVGSKEDRARFKLVLISIISGLIAYFSLSLLRMYAIVVETTRGTYPYGDMYFEGMGSSLFSGVVNSMIIILIMGLSYLIYSYYKKEINKTYKLSFPFFETIMTCIWISPLLIILPYEILPYIPYFDSRLIKYIVLISFVILIVKNLTQLNIKTTQEDK